MASVVLPFLMSMLLGRTIDLTTYNVGGDIYDHSHYDETPIHALNSTYVVLQKNVFPHTYVGLPADLVLRIKSGFLQSSSGALGLDGFLRDSSWKSNSVVVAVNTLVQTVRRELKPDASLLPDWVDHIDNHQTHYVDSLIYGGWSCILYRFKYDEPADEEEVRRIVTSTLGLFGEMNQRSIDSLNKIFESLKESQQLRGSVSLAVQYYSSARHSLQISTPENLWSAIQKFPEDVGPDGKPLYMTLKPLHALSKRFPEVKEDHKLDLDLEKLDELFDDLKEAKTGIRKWISETLTEFSEVDEEKIHDLLGYVTNCITVYLKIAREASIFKAMDSKLIKSAVAQYVKGLPPKVETYVQQYKRLREDIDSSCTEEFKSGIKGTLNVAPNEKLEFGEHVLEECKSLCLEEEHCKAIGHTESMLVVEGAGGKMSQQRKSGLRLVHKKNQCWIYFRSTDTARLLSPKKNQDFTVYDRKCF